MVQYPCVSCLGKYAGAAYGNVPIFSGGDPAVSLFTGTDALGREADSPAGEPWVRAKEEKSGWSGEKVQAGKQLVYGWISGLLLAAGILYFLYVACCGINYYRTSFSESSGIVAEEYTVGELTEVCQWLTAEVNDLSSQVERDADGIMRTDDGVQERAVKAMQALGETYPELSGYYPEPKGLFQSMDPFCTAAVRHLFTLTIEANYNSGMVDYNIPFTACHELSHLKKFYAGAGGELYRISCQYLL